MVLSFGGFVASRMHFLAGFDMLCCWVVPVDGGFDCDFRFV